MNNGCEGNELNDRLDHPTDENGNSDNESAGSGNNNQDQMYAYYQQQILFIEPISKEILIQYANNDPDVSTREQFWKRFNEDWIMESTIDSLSNSYTDLGTFDWVSCSYCGECPCTWLKIRGAIEMFARQRWGDYLRIGHLSKNQRLDRRRLVVALAKRLKYGYPRCREINELDSCILQNIASNFPTTE